MGICGYLWVFVICPDVRADGMQKNNKNKHRDMECSGERGVFF